MIIFRTLNFRGTKGQAEVNSLFDSGSTFSCIDPDYLAKLDTPLSLPDPFDLETATKGHFIKVEQRALLDFYLNNIRMSDEFMVVPGLAEEAIIGALTMQKWKIKLDFENDEVITDPRVSRLILM